MADSLKAVIFCSSYPGIDPLYNDCARRVVRVLAGHGYGIVSGGATKGTMKVVCDEAAALGISNEGAIPRFMAQYAHPSLDSLVWTDTMAERKEAMRAGTSLAVALPGGIGTMDEFFETFTLAKLGKYSGRIVALNIGGYFDPLKALLEHMVDNGMLGRQELSPVAFPESVEEFENMLN